jgi:hypothetical protein
LGFHQFSHEVVVTEQFEGLLEAVEVVRTDQYGGGSAVAGDDHAFVLAVDAVDELGEPVLYVPQ